MSFSYTDKEIYEARRGMLDSTDASDISFEIKQVTDEFKMKWLDKSQYISLLKEGILGLICLYEKLDEESKYEKSFESKCFNVYPAEMRDGC